MQKFLVILAVCLVGAYAGKLSKEQEKLLKPFKEDCLKETKTDEALFEDIKKNVGTKGYDERINCFSACMFKSLGMMSEGGKMEEDVVSALMSASVPQDKLDVAIANCKNEVGKDDCESAGKLIKCFLKHGAAIETS